MKLLCCVLCALLVPAVVPAAESSYEDGKKAYDNGKYEEAFEIFMGLFRRNPQDEDLNYSMGLAAAKVGKTSHAIFAYERALTLNPQNGPARLELGRNWMTLKQYEMAQEEFDRLLALRPPEDIRNAADKELAKLTQPGQRWRIEGALSLSGIWDDNSNYGPKSDILHTATGDYATDAGLMPRETWGSAGNANILYTYDFGAVNGWEYSLGGQGYIKRLADASDEEISYIRGDAILRHIKKDTLLELPLKASMAQYGNDHLFDLYGTEPMFLYAIKPKLQIMARGNVEYRDYKTDDERDSMFEEAGLVLRRLPEGRQPLLSAQVYAFNEDADAETYDNDGWRALIYGNMEIADSLFAYVSVQYRETFYDAILYPGYQEHAREDEQMQYMIGLQSTILPNLILDFNIRHIDNRANFDLYDYEKNVATVSTIYNF